MDWYDILDHAKVISFQRIRNVVFQAICNIYRKISPGELWEQFHRSQTPPQTVFG